MSLQIAIDIPDIVLALRTTFLSRKVKGTVIPVTFGENHPVSAEFRFSIDNHWHIQLDMETLLGFKTQANLLEFLRRHFHNVIYNQTEAQHGST